MYPTQFGFPPSSNSVLVPTPYMGVLSNYDYFDSIPFPFISCSFDPQYEMLWCSTQNVGMGVRISLLGISKRILPIQSSFAVFCGSHSQPMYLQYAVYANVGERWMCDA